MISPSVHLEARKNDESRNFLRELQLRRPCTTAPQFVRRAARRRVISRRDVV